MSRRRILVLNSGDGTGLNFTRSLHKTGQWDVIGIDCSLADFHGSEADHRYLFVWQNPAELIQFVNQTAAKHGVDLVYVADTGPEMLAVSQHRNEIEALTFLPDVADHLRMEDKWQTLLALRAAGVRTPDTELVRDSNALEAMLERHGIIWLRRTSGSAGAGSVNTDSLAFAQAWIERYEGWNQFTAAQYLKGRTATFSGVWADGELIASQLRERTAWKYPYLSVSGVTGITAGQRTFWDEQLHELALDCVRASAARPHGAIGVDFTFDEVGNAFPTEVQPARLYSSVQFLAELGLNLPAIYCDVALGRHLRQPHLINPIRHSMYWVKAVDRLPQLLTEEQYFGGGEGTLV